MRGRECVIQQYFYPCPIPNPTLLPPPTPPGAGQKVLESLMIKDNE
jgi:hypothetical protein